MTTYLAIPLTASTLLVSFGCVIMAIGQSGRANRRAALLLFGAGFWAFCEVLWNTAPDTATALAYQKLALPGIAFVGPLSLSLVGEVTERRIDWLPRVLPIGYAACFAFLAAGWFGPYLIAEMVRTPWGYGLVPGPLFSAWLGMSSLIMATAIVEFVRGYSTSSALVDRTRGPIVIVLTFMTVAGGLISDGVLPILGIQLPRIGTLSFAAFGGVLLWALHRFGYSNLPNREFARRIIRTLPDALVLTSLNGRVRVANDKLEALIGCREGRSVGMSLGEILDLPLLDPPREVRQMECELVRLDGERVPVTLSSSRMLDNNDTLMGLVVIISDQREMVSLRNQVITSDRLAAVGQLAAGIAHEINNPLAFVRSNLNLLHREWRDFSQDLSKYALPEDALRPSEDWDELIEESLDGVDRAATIVRDVRDFSHAGSGQHELADLVELLDQVVRMATPQLAAGIDLVRDYGEIGLVGCQPQRLKQLFLNLVVNAAHAVDEAGKITVRTRRDAGSVIVEVEDDGCGIPDDSMEHVFDPFFTTKDVGVGTGLGLAISHEIVRAHDGSIRVERCANGGTIFRVELPAEAREDSLALGGGAD